LIGRLEVAKATAWARLISPGPSSQVHDELLGVPEAARRLGVSEDYLYSHHQEYAFTGARAGSFCFPPWALTVLSGKNDT